ncbi:MAG: CidA/LrgA family protein [Burkholderiaceae bacterium]|jgi:holin-like protein|nr:CidA/LrgA family protein [Burkholderiaceae bacterium]
MLSFVRQSAIILLFLGLGEGIAYLTEDVFPSALIGMLLLALCLRLGWVRLTWVKGVSDFLIRYFGLFFIPPGVALMLHMDLIREEWLSVTVAMLVSTFLVMGLTGWTYQLVRRRQKK